MLRWWDPKGISEGCWGYVFNRALGQSLNIQAGVGQLWCGPFIWRARTFSWGKCGWQLWGLDFPPTQAVLNFIVGNMQRWEAFLLLNWPGGGRSKISGSNNFERLLLASGNWALRRISHDFRGQAGVERLHWRLEVNEFCLAGNSRGGKLWSASCVCYSSVSQLWSPMLGGTWKWPMSSVSLNLGAACAKTSAAVITKGLAATSGRYVLRRTQSHDSSDQPGDG